MHARPIAVVAIVLVGLLNSDPASAAIKSIQYADDSGVAAGTQSSTESDGPTGPGSGKASNITCRYVQLDASQVAFINQNADASTLNSGNGAGTTYNAICSDPSGNIVSVNQFQLPTATGPVALAAQAFDYRSLPTPKITLNPALSSPQLVNLATWLSVSTDTWQPVSASAAAGGVTATTTATPTQVVWTTGDGASVTCKGPGTIFKPTVSSSQQHSDCAYVYLRSSQSEPSGVFTLTATVSWSVNWTAVGVQAGQPVAGTLNGVTRTASVAVQVNEAGALNQST